MRFVEIIQKRRQLYYLDASALSSAVFSSAVSSFNGSDLSLQTVTCDSLAIKRDSARMKRVQYLTSHTDSALAVKSTARQLIPFAVVEASDG